MTEEVLTPTELEPNPVPAAPPGDDDTLPGSKVTYGNLRLSGVPDNIIDNLPAVIVAVKPRRVGLVESKEGSSRDQGVEPTPAISEDDGPED